MNVERKDKTFNLNFMTPTEDDLVEVMWNSATSPEVKKMVLTFLRDLEHNPHSYQERDKGIFFKPSMGVP